MKLIPSLGGRLTGKRARDIPFLTTGHSTILAVTAKMVPRPTAMLAVLNAQFIAGTVEVCKDERARSLTEVSIGPGP